MQRTECRIVRLARIRCESDGGDFEVATRIAGHESTRTTQLYNRVQEEISLDEIELIYI